MAIPTYILYENTTGHANARSWVLQLEITVKPIFHCAANPFVLGTGVGWDPQRHNFAFPIPTC